MELLLPFGLLLLSFWPLQCRGTSIGREKSFRGNSPIILDQARLFKGGIDPSIHPCVGGLIVQYNLRIYHGTQTIAIYFAFHFKQKGVFALAKFNLLSNPISWRLIKFHPLQMRVVRRELARSLDPRPSFKFGLGSGRREMFFVVSGKSFSSLSSSAGKRRRGGSLFRQLLLHFQRQKALCGLQNHNLHPSYSTLD